MGDGYLVIPNQLDPRHMYKYSSWGPIEWKASMAGLKLKTQFPEMQLFKQIACVLAASAAIVEAISPRQAKSNYYERLLAKRNPALFAKRDTACAPSTPQEAIAPKQNIWADLNEGEAQTVFDILKDEFNLTKLEDASPYDNYLMWIEVLRPNKTEAIAYLDYDGPLPERYARATLFLGTEEYTSEEYPNGYWQELQIGPLNTNATQLLEIWSTCTANQKLLMKLVSKTNLDGVVHRLSTRRNSSQTQCYQFWLIWLVKK